MRSWVRGILPSGWDKEYVASCLSKEGASAESGGKVTGVKKRSPKYPHPKEREPEDNLRITPAWPDNTLKLGWWHTGDRAAFQKVGSLWAGEGCVVHQRCVRDTTVKGLAAHSPVPVPRGTREQDFLLETESFLLSESHKKAHQNSSQASAESWWLSVYIFTTGKMILPLSLFTPGPNMQFHNTQVHCWWKVRVHIGSH